MVHKIQETKGKKKKKALRGY